MSRIILEHISLDLNTNAYQHVYTPTKAVARSLKTAHRTLEGRAETIVRKSGWRIASVLLSRRLLQKAIAKVLQAQDLAGITALWTPLVQELISSGANLDVLAEHSLVRVRELTQVASHYQKQLRAINCLDRSELFWQATTCCQLIKESGSDSEKKKLDHSCLIYGYFLPNRDQLAFINAISGDGSLLVLPNDKQEIFKDNQDSIAWLKEQNWQVKESEKITTDKHLGQYLSQQYLRQPNSINQKDQTGQNNPKLDLNVRLNHYANLDEEVRGVLTQVKLLLSQGAKPQSIVLVTKDEQLYGDTLLNVAWEYDLPIRAFYEISILNTRIGAWLELLLEAIATINSPENSLEVLSFELGSKLLAHPLANQLNEQIWQEAKRAYPRSLEAWQKLGIDLSILTLPNQAQNQEWLAIFKRVLEHFAIKEKASPWAKEIVAYYKFQDALQEMLFSSSPELSRQSFLTEFQELLTSLTIPIQPGRGGVELHSPLSLFGCSYEYVFVLGMAENIFPTAVSDDLVLGFRIRKQLASENLNLNTILKIITRESLAFYFLLQTPNKQITFSYPQAIDRQPVFPSPYLQKLDLQAQALEIEYLASIETARRVCLLGEQKIEDELLPVVINKWQIECDRDLQTLSNKEYSGQIDIELDYRQLTFSASQLTQLGQCPFKWFAARLLKLKELEESSLALDSKIRGILYHRCLELCLKEVKTAADLANMDREKLLTEAFNKVEQELDIPDIPAWASQKQELLKLLTINLSSPEFLPTGSEIFALEQDFKTHWHGLALRGMIDRLDRTTSGLQVIDYKSGGSVPPGIKDETGKATVDLQIPLYAEAIAEQYPEETVGAVYYSLSKRKAMRARRQSDPEELASFAEQVKHHLATGSYPIEPDIQLKACGYCQFDLVCRYQ